jgi:hypothetical protein
MQFNEQISETQKFLTVVLQKIWHYWLTSIGMLLQRLVVFSELTQFNPCSVFAQNSLHIILDNSVLSRLLFELVALGAKRGFLLCEPCVFGLQDRDARQLAAWQRCLYRSGSGLVDDKLAPVFSAVRVFVSRHFQPGGNVSGLLVVGGVLYQHRHVGELLLCGFDRGLGLVECGVCLSSIGLEIGGVQKAVLGEEVHRLGGFFEVAYLRSVGVFRPLLAGDDILDLLNQRDGGLVPVLARGASGRASNSLGDGIFCVVGSKRL